jgi:hypothetical protein
MLILSLSPACLLWNRVPGAGGGHPHGVRIQALRGHQAPAHPSLAQPSSHCCRVPGRVLQLLTLAPAAGEQNTQGRRWTHSQASRPIHQRISGFISSLTNEAFFISQLGRFEIKVWCNIFFNVTSFEQFLCKKKTALRLILNNDCMV